jgi:hypothetical protein
MWCSTDDGIAAICWVGIGVAVPEHDRHAGVRTVAVEVWERPQLQFRDGAFQVCGGHRDSHGFTRDEAAGLNHMALVIDS